MDIKELRKLLSSRQASWNVPPHIADDTPIANLTKAHALGALPEPPSALTARSPRIRVAADAPVVPWTPNTKMQLRKRGKGDGGPLPGKWDWRSVHGENYVTDVRDQGGCGSCVAFAATAALEAHHLIAHGRPAPLDLSESSLFFVSERQCFPGDPSVGWWVSAALDAAMDQGLCFETNYPYVPTNQNAELVDGSVLSLKLQGYDSSADVETMKRWLVEQGPLVTRFDVYDDFFMFWNTGADGVYKHVTGSGVGGHALMVLGYDDARGSWICKNSWGPTGQHADGCFMFGYGECGIDDRMYLPQGVRDVVTFDELWYDPRRLRIVDQGAKGFLLTDGRTRLKMFDTSEDARNGLRVARRYTRRGLVGRNNARPNAQEYVHEYWAGHSGLPWEPLTKTDIFTYDPNTVVAEDVDENGWRLRLGDFWSPLTDDMNDALTLLGVVERHTRMGFIGRNNPRPNRLDYIMTYCE